MKIASSRKDQFDWNSEFEIEAVLFELITRTIRGMLV